MSQVASSGTRQRVRAAAKGNGGRSVLRYRNTLLNVCYPINASHSKLISVGIDCNATFGVSVQFYKYGRDSVFLSHDEWKRFAEQYHHVDAFFANDPIVGCSGLFPPVSLTANEVDTALLQFREVYDKRMIVLSSLCKDTGERREVFLARESWLGFLRVLPCVRKALQSRLQWAPVIALWYKAFVPYVVNYLIESGNRFQCKDMVFVTACLRDVLRRDIAIEEEGYQCLDSMKDFNYSQFYIEMHVFFQDILLQDVMYIIDNGTEIDTKSYNQLSLKLFD